MQSEENSIRKLEDDLYKVQRQLNSLSEDIQNIQEIQQMSTTRLSAIMTDSSKLHNLFKVVIEGNGEPALKTQAVLLQRDINVINENLNNLPSKLDITLINQKLEKLDTQILELKSQADKLKDIRDKLGFEIIKTILMISVAAGFGWVGKMVWQEIRKPHSKPVAIDTAYVIYMADNGRNILDKGQHNNIEYHTR